MNNFPNLLRLATLVLLFASYKATAQNVSLALDAKNGFRDAKFGMPASAFKGLVKDHEKSGDQLAFYSRPSDKKLIGDIEVKSIAYRFYTNKLAAVIIKAPQGEGQNLLTTFSEAYGKPRPYTSADQPETYRLRMALTNNEARGLVWEGKNVKMIMWFGLNRASVIDFRDCLVVISSKAIEVESNQEKERIKRQKLKRRADDL